MNVPGEKEPAPVVEGSLWGKTGELEIRIRGTSKWWRTQLGVLAKATSSGCPTLTKLSHLVSKAEKIEKGEMIDL